MKKTIQDILIELKLSDNDSFELFSDHTRDNDHLRVLRCKKSECIILENTNHINDLYYKNKDSYSYWGTKSRKKALLKTKVDDERRLNQFKKNIENKIWLDVGCGNGGLLELFTPFAKIAHGVELQENVRKYLNKKGFTIFDSIASCRDNFYDVITLFHVFEHILYPLDFLKLLKNKLKKNGLLIIEVPHSQDALISKYKCQSFIENTLWSEHLCLHSKKTLSKFIKASGFLDIKINGIQRYSLTNHIYWLSNNKPNGQNIWKKLFNSKINEQYDKILIDNDISDTLIAKARKK